jgi:hypothetical protein
VIRVFLAGEGRHELAGRKGDDVYQSDRDPGVVQALLRKVRADGWEVVGSIDWKDIKKLQVNSPGTGDAKNVHRACWKAKKAKADVLVFVRDRDRKAVREREIERAIAETEASDSVHIVGSVAIESIEGWLIALTGKSGSESIRHPEKNLADLGLRAKHGPDYVAHVEKHGISGVAQDATSLKRWLKRARHALDVASTDE